jgi:beta-glucosidase
MSTRFTRRDVTKAAGSAALGMSATAIEASAQETSASEQTGPGLTASPQFPKDFLWGTATASYQVEGAVNEDGRGPSVWDTFSHTPGKIKDKSNGDVAVDMYHRFNEDVQLMKALGVKAYRFSISWPRVFPEGTGTANPKGLDFYNRLLEELIANGIEPFATLYHWDLPQALQDGLGGWESRDTPKAFADYTGYVAERLTDRVKHVCTMNELWTFMEIGHASGTHAPGLKLPPGRLNQARHHALLGHGLAVQAIRAKGRPGTKVGSAENMAVCVPVIETAEHIRAAERATREFNAPYLTAMLEGRYLETFLSSAGAEAPKFTSEDMQAIGSPLDFVGINVYTPAHYIRASSDARGFAVVPRPASFPRVEPEWLFVGPEALYWAPRHLASIWQVQDIYVTENGCAAADVPATNGIVYDTDRIMFLRNYLTQLQRATSAGVPVRGYFVWTLMDNFEWADGYSSRFGLHHVDFATQKRTPKLSASFYREVIARNALA